MIRKLGRSEIKVSGLGMGCWAIGGPAWRGDIPVGWGEVDDDESIRAIHTAIDLGITFFDTANVYGAGHSERVLGRALAGRRSKVVVASKFTGVFDEATRQITGSDYTASGIRRACEESLGRLKTDYLDLYQFHEGGCPINEAGAVRDTLEQLVNEGKIRAYGWSTDLADRAEFFAGGPKCAAVQLQLNVLNDNPDMIAVCEKFDLAAINRGPLAMGLLTGKYDADTKVAADDVRGKHSPAWMKYFKEGKPSAEWMAKRDAVRDILTGDGRTEAQGALGWLWARSDKTIPIPGIRTVKQARENAGALEFGPLDPRSMEEIDRILGRKSV